MINKNDTNRNTPNEALAAHIVIALQAGGLAPDNNKDSILSKLGNGNARESDWRLWAKDIVLAKESSDGDKPKDR